MSLNVKQAEIVSVLKTIAEKAKIDLSIGATVHGRISLKMEDATIKDVLERLSENTAFVFEYLPKEKAYRIVKAGAYASENPDNYTLKAESLVLKSKQKHAGLITSENTGGKKVDGSSLAQLRLHPSQSQVPHGRLLYKPGELLVKFKPGVTDEQISELHQVIGSNVIKKIKQINLYKVKLPEGLSEAMAISQYQSADIVVFADRHALRYANYYLMIRFSPNNGTFLASLRLMLGI